MVEPIGRRRRRRRAQLLIVDDHDLARAGTRQLLRGAPGLEVIADVATVGEALPLCLQFHPDLVLMDVRLADMDGLAATRIIRHIVPETRVLLFTMYESSDYMAAATRAGAAGYVLKGASRRELLQAIRSALRRPS